MSFEGIQTIYGKCAISAAVMGRPHCAMHSGLVADDALMKRVCGAGYGTIPMLRSIAQGVRVACHCKMKVLEADLEFVRAAVDLTVKGVAWMLPKGLHGARRWGTGTTFGIGAFGRGYCYLGLFRDEFQYRVARVLGPFPRVVDVLVLLRVAGAYEICGSLVEVAPGCFHVADKGVKQRVQQVVFSLYDAVAKVPNARIGAAADRVWCDYCGFYVKLEDQCGRPELAGACHEGLGLEVDDGEQFVDAAEKPGKGWCDRCGFLVKLEGHEGRCRPKKAVDDGAAFLGDALHAYDVKRLVVAGLPAGSQYTEIAKRYLSAFAQAEYMRAIGMAGDDWSERQLSTRFERVYSGEFRQAYLEWAVEQMSVERLRWDNCVFVGDHSVIVERKGQKLSVGMLFFLLGVIVGFVGVVLMMLSAF